MLEGIYDGLNMGMNPTHQEVVWLLEKAEQLRVLENAVKEIITHVKSHNEELSLDCEKILESWSQT